MSDAEKVQVNEQIHEVKDNFEHNINECNAGSEYKFNCAADKIEEIRDKIKTYETNTNLKINEIESTCKIEIQAIQDTVNVMDRCSMQFECLNNDKFASIEQTIVNVKHELNVVISKKLNSVAERVVITRDMNTCLLYTSRCV